MKTPANLNKAIESHIQANVEDYIQFGEFDPTLSAIRNAARLIQDYCDPSYFYEAMDGDTTIAKDLYLLAFEREYYSQTDTIMLIRRKLISHASRLLAGYEHFAWRCWEDRSPIDPELPDEPDINVQMPELRELGKLIADFETEFTKA